MRRYLRHRLIVPLFRSPHPPAYTARGVANGVFWGLTPTVGLQSLEILATWVVARRVFGKESSVLQAMIWVWVNNPITMIPLYYAFYVTGLWLLADPASATGYAAFAALWNGSADGWLAHTVTLARAVGGAMLIGCVPFAIAGAALSYAWALRVVAARQQRIRLRRLSLHAP